jgi:hypothetical protein
MTITCPSCGAPDQEVGKFCENCGFFITSADAQAPATPAAPTTPSDPAADPTAGQSMTSPATADPAAQPPTITPVSGVIPPPQTGGAAPAGSAQFAIVVGGKADPAQGFTITRAGEYLVGRTDSESGSQADIDVRQWVQPMDIHGQKQFLIHRKQCYLGLTADGAATIRQCPGAELDTLVKPAGSDTFTALQVFGTIRTPRPDTSYELEPGDQIFMGDPDALPFYQTGAPTAAGSYLVLELLPRP